MPLDARRQACLDAMDIDVWVPRDAPVATASPQASTPEPVRVPEAIAPAASALPRSKPSVSPAPQGLASAERREPETDAPWDNAMPSDDLPPLDAYLDGPIPDDDDVDHDVDLPLDFGVSQLGWEALADRVAACTRCDLHKTRTNTVFGVGDRKARLMIVGEAPGRDEDVQGEPFVGRAGMLLNAMLKAIGLEREQVYIANVLKCRPPNNRDPQAPEVAACSGYLWRQVQLVQPTVLVALGRHAAHSLLETSESLARLRGRSHALRDFELPVVVTYHPAYLLRTPADKRKAWDDLRYVRRLLQGR
ncbi:MAG: uracil-DNA glycosylase [Zoogloeaceae bacterium]|nr:uracil-DNA glycosylase [Zoogloeaceae bacterium]